MNMKPHTTAIPTRHWKTEGESLTSELLSLDTQTIHQAIKTDGCFTMENALGVPGIEAMMHDVEENRCAINRNWIGGVFAE